MNTTTEKQELIDRIQETNDETLIQDLRAIIDDRSTDITWNDLPKRLKEDVRTAQAQEKTGIIIDYDKSGNIVGIELLDASTKMNKPGSLVYEVE